MTQQSINDIVVMGGEEPGDMFSVADGRAFNALYDQFMSDKAETATNPAQLGAKHDGTDATAIIQSVLDTAVEGGLIDLNGHNFSVTGVTINKKIKLVNGKLSLLPTALQSALTVASNVIGAELENIDTFMNRATLTATDASGIFIDGATDTLLINCHADGSKNDNYGLPYLHSGIYAHNANGVTLIDCSAKNAHKEGIMTRTSDNVTYINAKGFDCGNSGVGTSGGVGLHAENCYAENSGASGLTFNSQNALIINPKSKNNLSQNAITVGHSNEAVQYAGDCTIINPMVDGCPSLGLAVVYSKDCTIIGGKFKNIGTDAIKVIPNPDEVGTTRVTGDVMVDTCGGMGINVSCGSAPSIVDVIITDFEIKNCVGLGVRVMANGDTHISDGMIKGVESGIQVNGTTVGDVRAGTMKLANIKDVNISDTQKSSIIAYNVSELIIDGEHHRNINISNDVDSHVIRTYGTIPGGTATIPMPNPLVVINNTTKTISSVSIFVSV